jgi:hypothetical protein
MNDSVATPRVEDLASVGTRISWGAILAGTFLALAIYFLLATLGGAVGLSVSDRVDPSTLQPGTIAWAFLTTVAALFVGGMVTSLYTVGENKTEAVMSGVIMWALLFTVLLILGGVGIRAGFYAMQAASAPTASPGWEAAAKDAGVPADQIANWRRAQSRTPVEHDPQARQAGLDAAKRVGWYAFAGTWLSMLAAAAGALVGAGPTFRLIAVPVARSADYGRRDPALQP